MHCTGLNIGAKRPEMPQPGQLGRADKSLMKFQDSRPIYHFGHSAAGTAVKSEWTSIV